MPPKSRSSCVDLPIEDCMLAQTCQWTKQSKTGRKPHCRVVPAWTEKGGSTALKEWTDHLSAFRTANPQMSYVKARAEASQAWHKARGTTPKIKTRKSQTGGGGGTVIVKPGVYDAAWAKYGKEIYNRRLDELAAEFGQDAFPLSWGELRLSSADERENGNPNREPGSLKLWEITEGPAYEDNKTVDDLIRGWQHAEGLDEDFADVSLVSPNEWQNMLSMIKLAQIDYANMDEPAAARSSRSSSSSNRSDDEGEGDEWGQHISDVVGRMRQGVPVSELVGDIRSFLESHGVTLPKAPQKGGKYRRTKQHKW